MGRCGPVAGSTDGDHAAGGQRSSTRASTPAFSANTRARYETISTVQPTRRSAARSVSVGPHDAPAGDAPAVGERQGDPASLHGPERLFSGHAEPAFEAERRAHGLNLFGVEHPPDQRLAGVGRKPPDPQVLGRQPIPYRQQQSRCEPEPRLAVARQRRGFGVPETVPFGFRGLAPVRGPQFLPRHRLPGGGPDEARAFLHPAVVEQPRRRGQHHRGAIRAPVDRQPRLAAGAGVARGQRQGCTGCQRLQPVAADDLDEFRDRTRGGMPVKGLPPRDRQRVRAHGFHADLERAGLDGLLDVRGDALFQFGEQGVLLVDGQRQQPVEELRHRRQVLLEGALAGQLQPGCVLEPRGRPAVDAPEPQRPVELAQRRPGVGTFEVVALAEQRLTAAHGGLAVALATGDGAQTVEPPGDGGDEPPLALDVRGHGAEQRRAGLMRAVGAPQPLDRLIGAPAGLEQVVHAPPGVGASPVGMVAAPRP